MSSPTEHDVSNIIDDWTSETQRYQSSEHAGAIGRLADLARKVIQERDEARAEILRMCEAAAQLAGAFDDRGDYWTARARGYDSAYESGMAEAFYYAAGKVEDAFNQWSPRRPEFDPRYPQITK